MRHVPIWFLSLSAAIIVGTADPSGAGMDPAGSAEVTRARCATPDRCKHPVEAGQDVTIGIRPEHFLGTPEGPGLEVRIDVVENLGGIAYAYGKTNARQDVIIKAESETPPRSGMVVTASIKDEYCHLFDAAGRTLSTPAGAVRKRDAAA